MKRIVLTISLALGSYCAAAADLDASALKANSQREVIEQAAEVIQARYVDPAMGRKVADAIRKEAKSDAFKRDSEPEAFAQALTMELRKLSGDGHFRINYSAQPVPLPDARTADQYEEDDDSWAGPAVNHGFESVRRIDDNIGYLDLRVFAPPRVAADMLQSAMTLLAQSKVLIIDLRNNGGGDSGMDMLMAAYLLDKPAEMSAIYDRPSNQLTRTTTPVWVPGRRFGGTKPVYVLISHKTFSAAEAFAYDLQAMKRITVVGEASGGGAHPYERRRLTDHFLIKLPEMRSINPITGTDWQGVGVKPDVPTPPDQALDKALELAHAALAKEATSAGKSTH
ncbi:S41 family peptidase [Dyella subtropica]|uniref:S41 family peptidase n=1 Tax=Dyella subtropica TaxID=2992127 RepID=UPI00224D93B0|nr:S41 family peptidase [Dyella subtropica]